MQGTISFDGTLSGGITGGGGGGSEVTITPTISSGTKIADYEIDGDAGELYAPTPEALPGTIITKVQREYNDTTQTKIAKVTTLDTSNNQETSQDLYAPSPVQCWYTPGLEQDYQIGQFTYGGVTQNVYIPYFQRPLTAGNNITIDADNVISASGNIDYSTTEQDTGIKWLDNKPVYQRICQFTMVNGGGNWQTVAHNIADIDTIIKFETVVESLGTVYPIPAIRNSSSFILIGMSVTDFLYINNWLATTDNPKVTAIIQYTKTV